MFERSCEIDTVRIPAGVGVERAIDGANSKATPSTAQALAFPRRSLPLKTFMARVAALMLSAPKKRLTWVIVRASGPPYTCVCEIVSNLKVIDGWRKSSEMPKPIPEYDERDPAMLVQRLIGLANRETAGASTMFMYESGLTFPQVIVMHALTWLGPLPISALAEKLRLSVAATSQLVERLVQEEYVAREEDPGDRRVRLVRMRPHGKQFMGRLNEIRRRELADAFDRLPPKLRAQLTDVLRDAVEALTRVDPAAER